MASDPLAAGRERADELASAQSSCARMLLDLLDLPVPAQVHDVPDTLAVCVYREIQHAATCRPVVADARHVADVLRGLRFVLLHEGLRGDARVAGGRDALLRARHGG